MYDIDIMSIWNYGRNPLPVDEPEKDFNTEVELEPEDADVSNPPDWVDWYDN